MKGHVKKEIPADKRANVNTELTRKIRILFSCIPITLSSVRSSFVQRDMELLRRHFDVNVVNFDKRLHTLRRNLFGMLKSVLFADLTFSWFADLNAFFAVLLSKIFGKKSVVIVGGYDAAKVPEIEYGLLRNPIYACIVKFVVENANKILTVDESLKNDIISNLGVDGRNIETVPTGYDPEFWKPSGKKENISLTVAHVTKTTIKRKGLETFMEAAKYLPNVKFVLVGPHLDRSIEKLRSIATSNVEFTGFVSDEELLRIYQEAKVYCQLSRYEGLPNSLCEAMLCECVPVGTTYCGIPTAIGETGFYVPYGNEKATAEMIKNALQSTKGKEARRRIKDVFPMARRERELVKVIKELVK